MKSIAAIVIALTSMTAYADNAGVNCSLYSNSRDQFSVSHWEDTLRNQGTQQISDFYREKQGVLSACPLDSFSRRNVENAMQAARNLLDQANNAKQKK
ncbi:hypothetical protein [Chromobacterium sp. CV08]|uniref:hypothetical protein n=1 Tax=Chromobacterium sp. CV08 TaxID=3133274 RepID=UPI003DA9C5FD